MSGVEGCDSGTFVQNGDEQMVAPHQKSQRIFYGQGSHAGQNRYVSQNVCAGMQNRSLPRGPHVSNAQNDAYKPSLSKFGHDAGQGYSGDTLHGFTTGNGQWRGSSGNKSHGQNVQFNDGPNVQHSSHGPNVQFNAGPNFVPSSNFVQLDQDDPGSPEPIGDGLGTSSTVVPLVWPPSSSTLEPCMMTPSVQGVSSQPTDPVLDVSVEQPQSHDPSTDVRTGLGSLPAHDYSANDGTELSDLPSEHGSGFSSDTNALSSSNMGLSAGVSSASDGQGTGMEISNKYESD
ncbi:hypothetical protein GOBAR_AA34150 [Gossypium barbadense]|uniref:Uncharacterized protein n=1 Tax=Gossypium barbadense TaxID=3634 RepID=A0A2P5W616_GOSBA|nr:hypothetical protein GOBAR_AA34150 [Gossypium barbadense]